MQPDFLEPPDFETREAEEIFGELMDESVKVTNWNRRQALKLLDKANEIEERAARIANSYRELAASLVIEAQSFANDQADLLASEFPMNESEDAEA